MEESSNDRIDPFHLDPLSKMPSSPNLPIIEATGGISISNPMY